MRRPIVFVRIAQIWRLSCFGYEATHRSSKADALRGRLQATGVMESSLNAQ